MVLLTGGYYYHTYFLLPYVKTTVKYFIGLIDLLILCICAFHTIKLVIFFLHLFIVVKFVYHYYLLDLETMLTGALASFQVFAISKYKLVHLNKYCSFVTKLNFYIKEINIGICRMSFANKYLISPFVFYSAVSHFSLNLYLITSLYFIQMSIFNRIMINSIIILQILFTLAFLQPIVALSKDFARPALLLSRVQICLSEKRKNTARYSLAFVSTKMKLLSFYERIHSEDAFRFTLGVIGKISNASIFQVFPHINFY